LADAEDSSIFRIRNAARVGNLNIEQKRRTSRTNSNTSHIPNL
jgi:hypothetical protein